MPPKSKSLGKAVQQRLFSSEPAPELPKTKSKQFDVKKTASLDIGSKGSTLLWKYGDGKTPNKLKISNWNVNGVRSVMTKGELQKYLETYKPDMLCLNETKIDKDAYEAKPIYLAGYFGYWNFCKCSSGYSGVAILSKYLALSVKEDLLEPDHSQYGRVLTAEYDKFFLITAYIPNAGQKLDRLKYRVDYYDKAFQSHCEKLRAKKPVFVCGDLNVCHQEIDIARPKGNERTAGFTQEERDSFNKFLGLGWIDTFRTLYPKYVKYSWWSMRTGGRAKNIGWRLDYFLVNKYAHKFVTNSLINNDIMGSDHCPIELLVDFSK